MSIDILNIAIVIAIVLGSVILHELAHGLVAYWLGDHTAKTAGRLTLNPINHIDPVMSIVVPVILFMLNAPIFGGAKPVPINSNNLKWREWGMALVALAGPLTNFLIAFLAFLIGHFSGVFNVVNESLVGGIFYYIVIINIGFMVFNLLPVPPLDGSRILYAIAPDGVRSILSVLESYGIVLIYVLIVFLGQFYSKIMSDAMTGIISFFYMIVGQ